MKKKQLNYKPKANSDWDYSVFNLQGIIDFISSFLQMMGNNENFNVRFLESQFSTAPTWKLFQFKTKNSNNPPIYQTGTREWHFCISMTLTVKKLI